MFFTRREVARLAMALAVAQAPAGTAVGGSQTFRHEDLKPNTSDPLTSRLMLNTRTHTVYRADVHEWEIPSGQAPHPPHQHVHEVLMLVRDGTMEVTIAGTTARLGPGSCVASNQMHGWRNDGTDVVRYFVLAFGVDNA
jgi:XRE family transcriptional regulator, regulator of sulfur utilization